MDELENDALSLLLLLDDHLLPLFLEWCSQEGCSDMVMFLLESDFLRYKSDLSFRSTQDKCNMKSSFHYLHPTHMLSNSQLHKMLLPSQHDSLHRLFKSRLPLHASYAQICDMVWYYLLKKSKQITQSIQWNSIRKYLIADSIVDSHPQPHLEANNNHTVATTTWVSLEDVVSDMTYCRYFERYLQIQSNELASLHCWLAVRRMLARVSPLHDTSRPRKYSFGDPASSSAHTGSNRSRSNTAEEVKPSFLSRWRGVPFTASSKAVVDSASSVLKRTTASMNIDSTTAQQQQQQCATEESATISADHHYTNPFEAFKILLTGTRSLQRQFFPRGSVGSLSTTSSAAQNCAGLPEPLRMEIAATLALNSTIRTEDIEVVDMSFAITCTNILEKLLRHVEQTLHHFLQGKYDQGFVQSNDYAVMIAYMKCHQSTTIMNYQQKIDFLYSAIRVEHILHWADQRCGGQLFIVYDSRSMVKKCWLGDISEEAFKQFQLQQKVKRNPSFRLKPHINTSQLHHHSAATAHNAVHNTTHNTSHPHPALHHHSSGVQTKAHKPSSPASHSTAHSSTAEAVPQLPLLVAITLDLCIPTAAQLSPAVLDNLTNIPHAVRMWAINDAVPSAAKQGLQCGPQQGAATSRRYLHSVESMLRGGDDVRDESVLLSSEGGNSTAALQQRVGTMFLQDTILEEMEEQSSSSSDYDSSEEVTSLFLNDVIDDNVLALQPSRSPRHSRINLQSPSRSTGSIYTSLSSVSNDSPHHHTHPAKEHHIVQLSLAEMDAHKVQQTYFNNTPNSSNIAHKTRSTPDIVCSVVLRLCCLLGLAEGDFEYTADRTVMTVLSSKTLRRLLAVLYGEDHAIATNSNSRSNSASFDALDPHDPNTEDNVKSDENDLFHVLLAVRCSAIRDDDCTISTVFAVRSEDLGVRSKPANLATYPKRTFKSAASISVVFSPCGKRTAGAQYDRSMQTLSVALQTVTRMAVGRDYGDITPTARVAPLVINTASAVQLLHVTDVYGSLWQDVLLSTFAVGTVASHPLFFSSDDESLYDLYLGSYPLSVKGDNSESVPQYSLLYTGCALYQKYHRDLLFSWPISRLLGIVDFSMSALIAQASIRPIVHMLLLLLTNRSVMVVSRSPTTLYQLQSMLPRLLHPYRVVQQTHSVHFLHCSEEVRRHFLLPSGSSSNHSTMAMSSPLQRAVSGPLCTATQEASNSISHTGHSGGGAAVGMTRSNSAGSNSHSMPSISIMPSLSRSHSNTHTTAQPPLGHSIYNFDVRAIIQASSPSADLKMGSQDHFDSDEPHVKETVPQNLSQLVFADAQAYHSVRREYSYNQHGDSSNVLEPFQDMLVFDLDAVTTSLLFAKDDEQHADFSPYDLRNASLFHGEHNAALQQLIAAVHNIHHTLRQDITALEAADDNKDNEAEFQQRLASLVFISNAAVEVAFHKFHTKLLLGALPEHLQHYHESNTISCQMQTLLATLLSKHSTASNNSSDDVNIASNGHVHNNAGSPSSVAEDVWRKEDIAKMDFDSFLAFYNDQTAHAVGSLSHVFYADFLTGLAPAFVDLLKRHGRMLNDWRF